MMGKKYDVRKQSLKGKLLFLVMVTLCMVFVSCSKNQDPNNTDDVINGKEQLEPTDMVDDEEGEEQEEEPAIYEAEVGSFLGGTKIETSQEGYSGTGYVVGFENDEDGIEFTVEVAEDGHYDLNFVSYSFGGEKTNLIYVDGEKMGEVSVLEAGFEDSILERVYMTAGEHTIRLMKYWGWIGVDRLQVTKSNPIDESIYEVSAQLINPNADDNTKRLMSYLTDIYGEYILSGQYGDGGIGSSEVMQIFKATGKLPAVIGLDLIDYTPSRVEKGTKGKAVEQAIKYDEVGGIVTFCWHWNAPTKYLYNTSENPWYSGFYTSATNINLGDIMSGKDQEGYDLLISDIDVIAEELKRLEDAGVPILWRPLHEASGGWFWWGASGAEPYIELWKLMYDRLTNVHGINNLIWVWNGQDKDWYPGDEYVDIIGVDIYAGNHVYASQAGAFTELLSYTDTNKIIALTENGAFVDPDLVFRDGTIWSWFATWSGEFIVSRVGFLTEDYNEKDMLIKVYQHERVLTKDELPDLKNYEIHE